jgi:hypothetical protein
MEEEWMRDRAFLRDLLRHHPQASPQELARMTGRSVSWVKKWRKRLTEGDSHDPSLLCSRSRAHHAPYFRWDVRVIQRIVEMRFSPPENADRVCLALVLCSTIFPVTRSCKPHRSHCPAPVERSGRSCTRRAVWCAVPKNRTTPMNPESRWKRSRWISRMSAASHLNRVRKASASMWSKSAILWMQAPRLLCWLKPERISTNKPRWKR